MGIEKVLMPLGPKFGAKVVRFSARNKIQLSLKLDRFSK
jgi:hypothetical protein